MYAGNPSRPDDDEFRLMIATWTETLQDLVPEQRLNEVFVYARRNRNSNFQMDVSEVCAAWNQIRESERHAMPRVGQYDYRGTNVCPHCNNTGTRLVVKRDPLMQRDYTYGIPCEVLK